ncbi:hypothetical protein H6F98_07975 [Microcoleus sp. FACHB-SPT15]|uniref:DUF5985 family protein n=1 Tax=Microcoleus sp. FACHB-SPT15 TaxID=2692830 RepID=UPI00177E8C2F|nr:DUF5985 family protein [Microcoleus sp. FACHB-SPT15]MBD1805385.1 hypothetical protein [Microcoleus sp. FACHB-SPT15]
MTSFLMGTVAMGCAIAGLFFLRFWKETKDRLFLSFTLAFFMLTINRTLLGFTPYANETTPDLYLLRLSAFLIILFGILDKNLHKG